MSAQANPTVARAQATSDRFVLDGATSIPKRKTTVSKLVFTILAALAVALLLSAAACLLPENDYQRWQLADPERLRWIYERTHFDPKPIDIAIVGPSRAQLGLSAAAIEQDLARQGKHVNVVNFAMLGSGRDLQWAILDELFKAKSPKVVVLEVDEQPYPFGHFFFKSVAPAEAIVFPPSPFPHNYLYNLAYLPIRKLKLFGANLFPSLFGLTKEFDPAHYARNRTDYSTSFIGDGKLVDMEHPVPRATLLAEPREPVPRTLVARLLTGSTAAKITFSLKKSRARRKPMARNSSSSICRCSKVSRPSAMRIFSNNSVPSSTTATSRRTTNCSRIGRI
jgi:hypothetical protein